MSFTFLVERVKRQRARHACWYQGRYYTERPAQHPHCRQGGKGDEPTLHHLNCEIPPDADQYAGTNLVYDALHAGEILHEALDDPWGRLLPFSRRPPFYYRPKR